MPCGSSSRRAAAALWRPLLLAPPREELPRRLDLGGERRSTESLPVVACQASRGRMCRALATRVVKTATPSYPQADMIEVLLCGHCGGPLPRPDAGVRFVTCRFCEATSDLHTGERQPAASESYLAPRMKFATELAAFERVLAERVAAGEAPLPAFRGAAASELSAIADADALTNVVFGIAAFFLKRK